MIDPTDGCPDCGTVDRTHAVDCDHVSDEIPAGEHTRETKTAIGDPCDTCEGPCRYGHCPECGGHSEHNYGCANLARQDRR
jgi:hypothetical protein